MKNKIIILGAGPIGLITGWLLSKSQWEVDIYEKIHLLGVCVDLDLEKFYLRYWSTYFSHPR